MQVQGDRLFCGRKGEEGDWHRICRGGYRRCRVNAEVNGLNHLSFFAGDMKEILTEAFVATHGRPDVIITDPPRAGMHQEVVQVIMNVAPERIVYVSCNPASQAQDVALMKDKYNW